MTHPRDKTWLSKYGGTLYWIIKAQDEIVTHWTYVRTVQTKRGTFGQYCNLRNYRNGHKHSGHNISNSVQWRHCRNIRSAHATKLQQRLHQTIFTRQKSIALQIRCYHTSYIFINKSGYSNWSTSHYVPCWVYCSMPAPKHHQVLFPQWMPWLRMVAHHRNSSIHRLLVCRTERCWQKFNNEGELNVYEA